MWRRPPGWLSFWRPSYLHFGVLPSYGWLSCSSTLIPLHLSCSPPLLSPPLSLCYLSFSPHSLSPSHPPTLLQNPSVGLQFSPFKAITLIFEQASVMAQTVVLLLQPYKLKPEKCLLCPLHPIYISCFWCFLELHYSAATSPGWGQGEDVRER